MTNKKLFETRKNKKKLQNNNEISVFSAKQDIPSTSSTYPTWLSQLNK